MIHDESLGQQALSALTNSAVNSFVSSLVQKLLPKMAESAKRVGTTMAVVESAYVPRFEEYLERAYERQSYITTLVFPNQRVFIKDLYSPLTAVTPDVGGETAVRLDHYDTGFLPAYRRILLVDAAGMGKSTVLRFLFLDCLERNAAVPVFIELRRLSKQHTILDYVLDELNAIDRQFDKDFVLELISRGEFVFFLDGYDEIAKDDRADVAKDIQSFVSKASNNLFIISSRPEGALAAFNNFQRFTIRPLTKEEAFQMVRTYAGGDGEGESLIERLSEPASKPILEFLENPLLVSLLVKAYRYRQTLPTKKAIFYRQVYDALFQDHDLSKGEFVRRKYSGLDIEDFHRVLRSVGYLTFRDQTISTDKDRWLKYITDAKERCPGLDFSSSDYFLDLTTTVPLVSPDGLDYKWNHRSIQEYFTAQFFCSDTKGNQDKILRKCADEANVDRYLTVLDLSYDIDYKVFRNSIIYDLICEFLRYYDQVSAANGPEPMSPAQDFLVRLCFLRNYVWVPDAVSQELGAAAGGQRNPMIIMAWVESSGLLNSQYLDPPTRTHTAFHMAVVGAIPRYINKRLLLLQILMDKNDGLAEDWATCLTRSRVDVPQLVAEGVLPPDRSLSIKSEMLTRRFDETQGHWLNWLLCGGIRSPASAPQVCLVPSRCRELKGKIEADRERDEAEFWLG